MLRKNTIIPLRQSECYLVIAISLTPRRNKIEELLISRSKSDNFYELNRLNTKLRCSKLIKRSLLLFLLYQFELNTFQSCLVVFVVLNLDIYLP